MNKQQFLELYMTCFPEDTITDADNLWATTPYNMIMASYYNSKPICMLVLMKGTLVAEQRSYPLYYVYAACTHPDHRKKGNMSRLLKASYKRSITDGRYGLFLKPATEKLSQYYYKEGFVPFSMVSEKKIFPGACHTALIKLSSSNSVYIRKRIIQNSFTSYIDWDSHVVLSALKNAVSCGGGFYTNSDLNPTILIHAEPKGKELIVKEAIGIHVLDYIPSLILHLSCESAVVRYLDKSSGSCYGMLMSSQAINKVENTYMGIALD